MKMDERKPGAARWFVKRLLKAPAAWIGAVFSVLVAYWMMSADVPIGGAICTGLMAGATLGALSYSIIVGISTLHRKAIGEADDGANEDEKVLIEELRRAELAQDADLLTKLLEERRVIFRLAAKEEANPDLAHTCRLVRAIVDQSVGRADELQDLARRIEDPVLEIPDGAEATVALIRELWVDAFRAIIDAKTRVRKGNALEEIDFLDDSTASNSSRSLSELTAQLREETKIAERVHDRVGKSLVAESIPRRSGIVFDDDVSGTDVREEEFE